VKKLIIIETPHIIAKKVSTYLLMLGVEPIIVARTVTTTAVTWAKSIITPMLMASLTG